MTIAALRPSHSMPSGFSSGGADTDCDPIPQPLILGKLMTGSTTADIKVPAGALILAAAIIPHPTSPASAGTIAVDNVTDASAIQAATDATIYSLTAESNVAPLAAAKVVRITSASMVGHAWGGIQVILPPKRA
jgi:hypothetical protein